MAKIEVVEETPMDQKPRKNPQGYPPYTKCKKAHLGECRAKNPNIVTAVERRDTMQNSVPTHPTMEMPRIRPNTQHPELMPCKLNWKGHPSAKEDYRPLN